MGFFKNFAQGVLEGSAAIAARDAANEDVILRNQAQIAASLNANKELEELKSRKEQEKADRLIKAQIEARKFELGIPISARIDGTAAEIQASQSLGGTASRQVRPTGKVEATKTEMGALNDVVEISPLDEPTQVTVPEFDQIAPTDFATAGLENLSPEAQAIILEKRKEEQDLARKEASTLSRQKAMADYRASLGRDSVATKKFEQGQDIMSKLKSAGAEFNTSYGVAPEEFDLYESPTVLRQARNDALKEIDPATLASVNSQIATADQMISIYKQGAKTGELSDLFVATTGAITQPLQEFFSPEKAALRRAASEKALAIASALKPMSNTDLAYAQDLALNRVVDTATNIKMTLVDKAVAERTQEYLMAKKAFIQNSVPHKLDSFEAAFSEYKENFPLFEPVKDAKGNEVPAAVVSDNYVPSFRQYQAMKAQNPDLTASQLKSGWTTLTEEERREY